MSAKLLSFKVLYIRTVIAMYAKWYMGYAGTYTVAIMLCTKRRVWLMKLVMKRVYRRFAIINI